MLFINLWYMFKTAQCFIKAYHSADWWYRNALSLSSEGFPKDAMKRSKKWPMVWIMMALTHWLNIHRYWENHVCVFPHQSCWNVCEWVLSCLRLKLQSACNAHCFSFPSTQLFTLQTFSFFPFCNFTPNLQTCYSVFLNIVKSSTSWK